MPKCEKVMMKKIRVGLVTYAMYGGGMETFLLRLGRYLTHQEMEVEIVTVVEQGAWFERIADYHIKAVHVSGLREGARFQNIVHSWRVGEVLCNRKYDVIFLNHATYAQASLGMLPDKVVVIPIFHNDLEAIYKVGCSNKKAWNVAVGVSPKIVNTVCDRIVDRPVKLVPHGVELPSEQDWKTRKGYCQPLQLTFVGRLLHQQKGIFFLPDILLGCKDRGIELCLTIVGEGPDGPQLIQDFETKGLSQIVKFVGMLPPEQVYTQLLNAHIMIMPSFFEGLPITLLESMACGCVPIVSHLPGITDYAIEDGINGRLVPVGGVVDSVDAIANIASNPGIWQQMSDAAHHSAVQRFSVEAMGETYLRLIKEGLADEYPLPVSRHWQLPIDVRILNWQRIFPRKRQDSGKRY